MLKIQKYRPKRRESEMKSFQFSNHCFHKFAFSSLLIVIFGGSKVISPNVTKREIEIAEVGDESSKTIATNSNADEAVLVRQKSVPKVSEKNSVTKDDGHEKKEIPMEECNFFRLFSLIFSLNLLF